MASSEHYEILLATSIYTCLITVQHYKQNPLLLRIWWTVLTCCFFWGGSSHWLGFTNFNLKVVLDWPLKKEAHAHTYTHTPAMSVSALTRSLYLRVKWKQRAERSRGSAPFVSAAGHRNRCLVSSGLFKKSGTQKRDREPRFSSAADIKEFCRASFSSVQRAGMRAAAGCSLSIYHIYMYIYVYFIYFVQHRWRLAQAPPLLWPWAKSS